jgi:hypothetical protein
MYDKNTRNLSVFLCSDRHQRYGQWLATDFIDVSKRGGWMSVKKSDKKFKRVKKPEDNSNLRNEWITAFEDLDRELEKICEKMDVQQQK